MKTNGDFPSLNLATLNAAALLLAKRDPVLADVLKRYGPPPLWKRPATFATLARIVIEQQVSLAAAKTMYERLRASCGGMVTANSVLLLSAEAMRSAGLSRQKTRSIHALALAVKQRRFSVSGLRRMSDDGAAIQIQSMLGFGVWSSDIYLMMALLRPDLLPTGDLGLVKGISEVCQCDFVSKTEIIERAERWRPWRSVATRMIWQVYLINRGKDAHAIASG
jgi:DNA-3-methyladenine glycosylase II